MPNHPPRANAERSAAAREQQRKQYESSPERVADRRFYSSTTWREFRARYLAKNPLCVHCERAGRLVAAKHVHHRTPRKTLVATRGWKAAFDVSELEGLCHSCHSTEEAKRRNATH
jgi:5-methylcytosine-specific restriction protein A